MSECVYVSRGRGSHTDVSVSECVYVSRGEGGKCANFSFRVSPYVNNLLLGGRGDEDLLFFFKYCFLSLLLQYYSTTTIISAFVNLLPVLIVL